jgi:prolyl oligopeptidase
MSYPCPRLSRAVNVVFVLLGAACAPRAPSPSPPMPLPSSSSPPVDAPPPAASKASFAYPETEQSPTSDVVFGVTVDDPYRWLEDAKNPRVLSWMADQDKLTRSTLAALPTQEPLRARLKELFYHDAIHAPYHRGGRYFYSRRHATKEKAIVYVREGEQGEERVLLDPNAMSDDGTVALKNWSVSWDGNLCAYTLSKNNADEATLFVRDVKTGKDLTVDVIEGAKYALASWTPDGKGFYYTRLPTDPSIPVPELPGRAEIRYHAIGQPPDKDELIHAATFDPTVFIGGWVTRDGKYLVVEVQHGWASNDVYFTALHPGDHGARAKPGEKAVGAGFTKLTSGSPFLHDVAYWKGHFFVSTNDGAPRYRVMRVEPSRPEREKWRELVKEAPDAKLDGIQVVGGHLVLSYLRNATSQLAVHDLEGKLVRNVPLPGIGSVAGVVGNPDEDVAYFYYSSFTDVPQIHRTSMRTGETKLWATIAYPVDTKQLTVEQVFYTSRDGTRVSMFVMRRKDTTPDRARPTILYGYGGFNINITPWFNPGVVAWLERGGVYAMPNLRGGGEYGEDWHKAGMLGNKQNVFDDFLGAAQWLIENGWTRPDRLAIHGGSNGGLLVGAAMTQRPDLFGAVLCSAPLLDMVRYHLVGSGKTWISEYGSAEDPEHFKALHAYSPYHHVKNGVRYPALLLLSPESDDRVDPMHARKFVAALQARNEGDAPIFLRVEKNAGHGGGDMIKKDVDKVADMYSFLLWRFGLAK